VTAETSPAPNLLSLGGLRAWPAICLRSAGLPFAALDALAAPDIAEAVDRGESIAALERRLSAYWAKVIATVAGADWTGLLLAALTWQNRRAVDNTVRPLLAGRYPPGAAKQRRKIAVLTSYLQRYAAKNDSIGFFGPTAWGGFAPSSRILRCRPETDLIAESRVFLEDWAAHELWSALVGDSPAIRRPALAPHVRLQGSTLLLPKGATIPVDPVSARVLRLCTGTRTIPDIAAAMGPPHDEPGAVARIIADLAATGMVGYATDSDPLADCADASPAARATLARCRDAVRELVGVARSPDELAGTLARLEAVFEAATGTPAHRAKDITPTARTLAWIESRRAVTFTLGPRVLRDLDPPMTVLLHIARWLVQESIGRIEASLRSTVDRSAQPAVPLTDLWLAHLDLWFAPEPLFLAPVVAELRERWARCVELPPGAHTITLAPDTVLTAVQREFPLATWTDCPVEAYACPDLLIGVEDGDPSGQPTYVLGELHLGRNTLGSNLFSTCGDIGPELDRQWQADGGQLVSINLSRAAVNTRMRSRFAPLAEREMATSLQSPALRRGALRPADFDVAADADRLTARHHDGTMTVPLLALLSDAIAVSLTNLFRPFAPTRHRPRVSLGRLIIDRESWTLTETETDRLRAASGAARLIEVRKLVRDLGMPSFLFARTTEGTKPFLVDTLSPASVDLLIRQLRRTTGPCVLTEMVPTPSDLWLTDAAGRAYTSEFRLAVRLYPRP
jgi:Lantibiotic dehydratase, N terminus